MPYPPDYPKMPGEPPRPNPNGSGPCPLPAGGLGSAGPVRSPWGRGGVPCCAGLLQSWLPSWRPGCFRRRRRTTGARRGGGGRTGELGAVPPADGGRPRRPAERRPRRHRRPAAGHGPADADRDPADPGQGDPVHQGRRVHPDLLPLAGVDRHRALRPRDRRLRQHGTRQWLAHLPGQRQRSTPSRRRCRRRATAPGWSASTSTGSRSGTTRAPAGHRPPGWDLFLTFATETGAYLDYTLTDGSVLGSHVENYSTDVLGARAARFVRRTPADQPLFLMFTPFAPHKPYRAPRRHQGTLDLPSYRPDSVTHSVRDKPAFLRDRPRVPQRAIDAIRTKQQEMLLPSTRRWPACCARCVGRAGSTTPWWSTCRTTAC